MQNISEASVLTIGRIPFLVCAPYFHASLAGLPGLRFVDGAPRILNQALLQGSVDCAPSSSFEYARHPEDYLLLPGLCTSGRGEVKSVLFFSQSPWESLHGKSVELSPESDTSNALFQVLCRFRFGVTPVLRLPGDPGAASFAGRVLIGDSALRESKAGKWPFRYDLAEAWESWQNTRLPFGLWMVRQAAWSARRKQVLAYHEHLQNSLAAFFQDPQAALDAWNRYYPLPLPFEEALAFFPTADYALSPSHENALRTFFELCRTAGLLQADPALRYARA